MDKQGMKTTVFKEYNMKYDEFVEKHCKNCVESCIGKPDSLSDICDVCLYENFEPTYFT